LTRPSPGASAPAAARPHDRQVVVPVRRVDVVDYRQLATFGRE
jgi:hypothetical protein